MSKSLKDQLLELGLAKEDTPGPARGKPAGDRRRTGPGRGRKPDSSQGARPARPRPPKTDAELSLEKAYALRNQQEKQERDRVRQEKLRKEKERRRINNEIRAIVLPNRVNAENADLHRYFLFKDRIRKVNVTAGQLAAINRGELGLVYLSGGYHILAQDWVAKVRSLSAEHVPELAGSGEGLEDDGVPDDLIW